MRDAHRVMMLSAVIAMSADSALAQHHWGYSGESGPGNWAKVDGANVLCALGRNQSPIDVKDGVKADLKPLALKYKKGATEILNNGHTVQVNYAPGSVLKVDGRDFALKQFHFHAPSENTINGKQFPLEGHLVHADEAGNLAVVAVLFDIGAANGLIEKAWSVMPVKAGDKASMPEGFDVAQMLPAGKAYYRFNGSLTTPPCSEGVRWFVLKNPVTVSREQVDKFTQSLGFSNNRPVQPVNARTILR